MPHQTNAVSSQPRRVSRVERVRRILAGAVPLAQDSDDESGDEDPSWEWIYDTEKPHCGDADTANDKSDESGEDESIAAAAAKRQRSRQTRNASRLREKKIIGARRGRVEFGLGDCVRLTADDSIVPWVGMISKFMEDDEDGKAANFLCKRRLRAVPFYDHRT